VTRGRQWIVASAWLACAGLAAGACRQTPVEARDPLMDVFRAQAQEEGLTREETSGKRLFEHYCATCHGAEGTGDGQNAYNLDPPPPDFHASLSANPPAYWRRIVEGGTASVGRSPLCPPWGRNLTAADIDELVAYLDILARPPAEPAAPAR